ncbi:hypothetical protein E2C01_026610 [Portunus trituberculatus]|uniref:Uncharacterized protein n=1 Tax=Portunus trituberculatus TaxID=210409 RepID=A0A5B7EIM1_PORTR|nr:hypothetical protein [Portunus trituberculatus]
MCGRHPSGDNALPPFPTISKSSVTAALPSPTPILGLNHSDHEVPNLLPGVTSGVVPHKTKGGSKRPGKAGPNSVDAASSPP